MADDLPNEFDLIVIGTGFPESVVSAAASRVGKTVLHVDPNDFYGGAWASMNLESLNTFFDNCRGGEIRNSSYRWHTNDKENPDEDIAASDGASCDSPKWNKTNLLEQSRRFNLDLCPKLLFSAGQLVKLLISSNICRYAEFRAVDRVCTRFHDEIINVPCSRSDVFNTKDLSIIEKRLLMKFLTFCVAYGEDKCEEDMMEFRGKTFREYLEQQKLTEKITTCIMQAFAMCTDETPFEEGMERTKKFLKSLGRYGNTPFLFPMYGCGEIPQCFCRLSAVFGGIYCLKRPIEEISIDEKTSEVNVVLDKQRIRAKHVVCSHGNVPSSAQRSNVGIDGSESSLVNTLSRGIFITSSPLGNEELNSGGGGVNILRLLADGREAIAIQLSYYSGTCPKGIYVFHLTTSALSDKPEKDLQAFSDQIFSGKALTPNVLYSAFFTITGRKEAISSTPTNTGTPIYCTASPYYELDYDMSIKSARDIFERMYADTEFLPRAPDPEEIVIEGEDPRALSENSLPEDLREQLRELERSAEQMDIEDETKENLVPGETAHKMDAD